VTLIIRQEIHNSVLLCCSIPEITDGETLAYNNILLDTYLFLATFLGLGIEKKTTFKLLSSPSLMNLCNKKDCCFGSHTHIISIEYIHGGSSLLQAIYCL